MYWKASCRDHPYSINIDNLIDTTCFNLKIGRVHMICSNFIWVRMFCNENCLKLVTEWFSSYFRLVHFSRWNVLIWKASKKYKKRTRKEWTLYGSFLQNLAIGQKLKKKPFIDVIFRFPSTCYCNWRVQHICKIGDIPSWSAPVFAPGHCMGRFALFVLGSTQNLHV